MLLRSTLLAAAAAVVLPQVAHAETIYGLLNNDGANQQLVTFDSVTRAVTSSVTLGIGAAGNSLASIDFRPSTGQLYGFTGATRQLYTINTTTGALTAVGPALGSTVISNATIDFNPTVDLIRYVGTTTTNQNLRVSPVTGAVTATDTNVAYAAGDSGAAGTPSIVNTAYTNSVSGATATTLYDLDAARDVLTIQTPPNNGTLTTVGALNFNIGSNGQGFGSFNGFDISGASGTAYLTDSGATPPAFFGGPLATTSTLFTVNLATGAATTAGLVSGLPFGRSISDIAVATVPEPASLSLAAGVVAFGLRRRRA